MASVIKRGKTWHATWKQDGITKTKRTGVLIKQEGKTSAQTRAIAQQMANLFEQAARKDTPLEILEGALRSIAVANGLGKPVPSIGEYIDSVRGTAGESSEKNRQRAFTTFKRFLGDSVALPLNRLTVEMCRDWVRYELGRVRSSTVGLYKGYISAALKQAYIAHKYIDRNPMDVVSVAAEAKAVGVEDDHTGREPFTVEEMRVLLNDAPAPWRDMVAASYYLAGLRLSDVCLLRWESVDYGHGVVKLREKKTRNLRTLTLHDELRRRLLAIRAGQREDEPYVFPAMAHRYHSSASSNISTDFTALLRSLGMAEMPTGDSLSGSRHHCSSKSFHSIRHAVVSFARNNPELSADVVRETVGHTSEAVEQGYFHASLESRRKVVDALAAAVAVPPPDTAA